MPQVELTVAAESRPIPASAGDALAGMIARRGRYASSVRDPLAVHALDLRAGGRRLTIVAADLLVIPAALHAAVAERSGVSPETLLLNASHTHSAPGGYWDLGPRGEIFMGRHNDAAAERIIATLSEAVRAVRSAPGASASIAASSATVVEANRNRRDHRGSVDRELLLVRITPAGQAPIDIVNFGAHPVVVAEGAPTAISADFPGAVRDVLHARGISALFLQGAVGGVNPETGSAGDVDERLRHLAESVAAAHERAVRTLEKIEVSEVIIDMLPVPVSRMKPRILPPSALSPIGELLLSPLRSWLRAMADDGLPENEARLHLIRLGPLAILGTPCDLGSNASLALKEALRKAGVRFPLVTSHSNGYVGYVHLRRDYDHVPEGRDRAHALYENAMSLSGWDLGDAFVASLARVLRAS